MAINGCSGGVSWFWRNILRRKPPYEYCCNEHDLAYEEGDGWCLPFCTNKDKELADRRLENCLDIANFDLEAKIFYKVVRVFGWLNWNICRIKYG